VDFPDLIISAHAGIQPHDRIVMPPGKTQVQGVHKDITGSKCAICFFSNILRVRLLIIKFISKVDFI
jgi:hypothetical protein